MLNVLRRKMSYAFRSWQNGGFPSHFVTEAPSAQSAVDLFKGEWGSRIPLEGVESGRSLLFEDERLIKLIHGESVEGMDVLELGPLEGAHSCMLEQRGVRSLCAVEANARAYLKCLVTKEIMGLRRTRFLLGDVYGHLRADQNTYDLLLAIGIIYHLRDPQKLFELAAPRLKSGGRLLVWTHYWSPAAENLPAMKGTFSGTREVELLDGSRTLLHRNEYGGGIFNKGFFGGNAAYCEWMSRDGLIQAAVASGFRLEREEDLVHSDAPSILASFRKV